MPGVTAAAPEADDFVELCERPAQLTRSDNIWELRELNEPPPVEGAPREAGDDDLPLVLDWWSYVGAPDELVRQPVEQRLAPGAGGGITLWEVGGETVSMCGYGSPTPNGMRIGPVYTPPERRGHGYASVLTAEVSRRLLEAGNRFCFLYTDAANPTSNAIYERIGYRMVAEAAAIAFE
jgi:GNAT superfamily N-acetyltransferase